MSGAPPLRQSALFRAAFLGDKATVARLLGEHEGRTQLNGLSEYLGGSQILRATPLYAAACGGHTDAVAALASAADCDLDAPSSCGTTPLLAACLLGFVDVVEELLAAGASVDEPDDDSSAPGLLNAAAQRGHRDVAELLLVAGCDKERRDSFGATALNTAAFHGHVDTVEALLAAGCDVDAATQHGWTPLSHAARAGHAGVAEALLAAGCDKDCAAAPDGWTPLHCACAEGHVDAVALLLAAGADRRTRLHSTGETPRDLAASRGHHAVVALFDQRPAEQAMGARLASAEARIKACANRQACLRLPAWYRRRARRRSSSNSVRPIDDPFTDPFADEAQRRLDTLWRLARACSLLALACSSGLAVRAALSLGRPVVVSYSVDGKPCLLVRSRWGPFIYPLLHVGLVCSQRLAEQRSRAHSPELQTAALGCSAASSLFLLYAFWRSATAPPTAKLRLPKLAIGSFLGALGFGAGVVAACAWLRRNQSRSSFEYV